MRIRRSTARATEPPESSTGRTSPRAEAAATDARPSGPEAFVRSEAQDPVERESDQSFPASDPPGWIASWTR